MTSLFPQGSTVRVATYAIGDVQGCFCTFQALLKALRFRPSQDRIWLCGDLVNRGPDSLEMLRWCAEHQPTTVLGNHDLYLLARGFAELKPKRLDTLDALLSAPDAPQLLAWTRNQPFLHLEEDWVMAHAGLPPHWTTDEAKRHAHRMEERLRGDGFMTWLVEPPPEDKTARFGLVMMRMLKANGKFEKKFKEAPEEAPTDLTPWYEIPSARSETILFGHWAMLGHRILPSAIALDSGCVWGGSLTAYCLETGVVTQVENQERSML